ncbi:MAG: hypothetical protein ABR953_14720 [Candidatus Acidiferrales bacterium]|jgi:hypothetical protein
MKKYTKPSLKGLGLLRVVTQTRFSDHCDTECGGPPTGVFGLF